MAQHPIPLEMVSERTRSLGSDGDIHVKSDDFTVRIIGIMDRSSCRVEQILHPDDVVQSAQLDKECSNWCWASELFTYLFGTCHNGQSWLETLISQNVTHRRAQPVIGKLDF